MDQAELFARVAIDELMQRYVYGVDGGPLPDVVGLFLEHGELVSHGGLVASGREEILAYLDRSRRARQEDAFGKLRHHISRSRLSFVDLDRAESIAYFAAFNARGADHWGVYTDSLVRVDGAWYFERRAVSIEGVDPDGWVGSGAAVVKYTSSGDAR